MTHTEDYTLRRNRVAAILKEKNIDAVLVSADIHCLYLTGQIFGGYCYLTADGELMLFSRHGGRFCDMEVHTVRKPEDIPGILSSLGKQLPASISLDEDSTGASEWLRLSKVFSEAVLVNGADVLRTARQIKTPLELAHIREAASQQVRTYEKIKELYQTGMTDTQLSIEIERELRLMGHSGIFRTFGYHMTAFMGTVLAGKNGYAPSPYDFALGGSGETGELPVGTNGSVIEKNVPVLVDVSGNCQGYLSDMTRTFTTGVLPDRAVYAHSVSIEIQNELQAMLKEGVPASALWLKAEEIAKKHGLSDCFMGLTKKAVFVGHGLGLEINERPVLTARDNTILAENMVIAAEPKFTIEGIGAVGVEDTFLVGKSGGELLTDFPHELQSLTE